MTVVPYSKDKQQAFQAAQQGTEQARDIYENIVKDDPDYGAHLKRLKNEVNEAVQQINNALEVASDSQRDQLQQFQDDLQSIVSEVNND
ncbi:CHASE3 domain sensor protein [Bacillus luteolus]|nr:CHASE3 domain sensor protein [Cytobacillus luteolus]